jgi:hypothetical protein
MTSVLISSKLEDVEAIRMRILLEKAGHNKFTQQQVLDMERDMFQSLGFRVYSPVQVHNEASIILTQIL